MSFTKPSSCCGFISIKVGASILLILSIIGSIINIYTVGFSNKYSEFIRNIYIIKSIIDLIFTFIGIIGVFGRKASILYIYLYFLAVEFVLSIITVFAVTYVIFISYGLVAAVLFLLIALMIIFISLHFIFVFGAYYDKLCDKKEEEEEEEEEGIVIIAAK